MKFKVEFTKKQLHDLADLATCWAYYYESEIRKAKARIDGGKISQAYRNRLCSNIAWYETQVLQHRQMHDHICEQHRRAEVEEAQDLQDKCNFLEQVHEVLADQGMLPEQYMNRLNLSLRLSAKYRQN